MVMGGNLTEVEHTIQYGRCTVKLYIPETYIRLLNNVISKISIKKIKLI